MVSLLRNSLRQFSLRCPNVTSYDTVNRFRAARGRALHRLIVALSQHLGRDIRVLDVGGRPDYWINVGFERISGIEVLNLFSSEADRPLPEGVPRDLFIPKVGDARNLMNYSDASVDLVHSNSVIEHVGGWNDMTAMASELLRVGRAGWVQTPAWGFPIEPHFRVPFAHWFARPLQARLMSFSFVKRHRESNMVQRRRNVEKINLLPRSEVEALFPGCRIYTERFILAKSYSCYWTPNGVSFETNT